MKPAPVQHGFDRRAASYDAHAHVQKAAAAWLAERLPEPIEGPALELGAGTGIFTRHLADRAADLLATDISPRMVRAGSAALPQVRWEVRDACAPLGRTGFAWVFSCSLAQWLADPGTALRRWHEAAMPGAHLLAGWFVRGTMKEFFAACPEAAAFAWRDEREWLEILAGAGWSATRAETKTFVARHENAAAMLREIHNLGAVHPRRFGAGRLRGVVRSFDAACAREGILETPFVFFRVEARRQ